MRESVIEAYLVKQVKAAGGETRKVKWVNRTGCPDQFVMLPNGCCWVEVKEEGGGIKFPKDAHERNQESEHKIMRKYRQRVFLIDSKEHVDKLVESYK